MKKLALIVIIFNILLYASYSKINRYSNTIRNGTTYEAKRAYKNLKSLYINSLLNSDKAIEERTLRALIAGGKKLGYNTYKYQKKLNRRFSKSITTHSTQKKHIVKKKKHKKVTYKSKKNIIKKVKVVNNKIHFYFSNNLRRSDLKYFILKTKKPYRYIFDIKAKILTKTKVYKIKKKISIKVGQSSSKIARIVVSSRYTIKPTYSISKNRLTIHVKNYSKKSKYKKPRIVKSKKINYTKKVANRSSRKHKIIVIDAGHGGRDSGAIVPRTRRYEKKLVLKIAQITARKLKRLGYKVYLTRNSDRFIKLANRTKFANKKSANIFISIHANSVGRISRRSKVHGVETYFLSPARSKRAKRVAAKENKNDMDAMNYQSKQTYLDIFNKQKIILSNKLAIDIQRSMLSQLKYRYKDIRDGGVREGPFWVLVGAQMPSVLVEVGFLSHPIESKRLFTKKYQNLLSNGIANGIDQYFRIN